MAAQQSVDTSVRAEMSRYGDCVCDMCFDNGYVVKVEIPYVAYDGMRDLYVRHKGLWMCESCRDKLVSAILIPYPKAQKGEENAT